MNKLFRKFIALGCGRAMIVILIIWFIVMILAILPMISNSNNSELEIDQELSQRLTQAMTNLDSLKKQNDELRKLLSDISSSQLIDDKSKQSELLETIRNRIHHTDRVLNNQQDFGYIASKEEPNVEYEKLRRKLETVIQEMGFYLTAELNNLIHRADVMTPNALQTKLNEILDMSLQHKRTILKDLSDLASVDGYETWREKEAKDLSDLVQRRLEYLQHPLDCSKAKKLVCNLNKGCGYGCQLHHLAFCLTVAYGTQRTLLLNSKGWRYHSGGWEEVFLPVSNSCTIRDNSDNYQRWSGRSSENDDDAQVLVLPVIDNLPQPIHYVAPYIPEDLAPRLVRLHGDPNAWWMGQLLKYLLRPQPPIAKMISQASKNIGFQKPIVGVHIRRTDKIGTEAAFHHLEEYMTEVDAYYKQLELAQPKNVVQNLVRRVYIATDDPTVISKAQKKYKNYQILGDSVIAKTASLSTRYSERSLLGIILDIHFLSISDYLVCTFSSQVCRVAYEIMQNHYPDASTRFRSLDDIYYVGGGGPHFKIAIFNHKPTRNDEIELEMYDKIHIFGNHWNGFSKGRNLRTNQVGLFPSFKVIDKIVTYKFPSYSEVT